MVHCYEGKTRDFYFVNNKYITPHNARLRCKININWGEYIKKVIKKSISQANNENVHYV